MGAVIVASALAKAALVILYFMHLRIERRLVHLIALFPVVLALVFVVGLIPDIGVGYWR
jgi:caa(3)-type oxidase subunit IV